LPLQQLAGSHLQLHSSEQGNLCFVEGEKEQTMFAWEHRNHVAQSFSTKLDLNKAGIHTLLARLPMAMRSWLHVFLLVSPNCFASWLSLLLLLLPMTTVCWA